MHVYNSLGIQVSSKNSNGVQIIDEEDEVIVNEINDYYLMIKLEDNHLDKVYTLRETEFKIRA